MAETRKEAPDRRIHPVGWELEDWERIERCAELLSAEMHLDLGATDVIRMGVRRLLEEKLGPVTEAPRVSA